MAINSVNTNSGRIFLFNDSDQFYDAINYIDTHPDIFPLIHHFGTNAYRIHDNQLNEKYFVLGPNSSATVADIKAAS